jgi:hypothetical protein
MNKVSFLILLIFIAYNSILAQPEIILPAEVNIIINDSVFDPSESWTDSLITEAQAGYLRYEIASTYRQSSKIQTKIRIPQFFTFSQVIRQIVFYYALLSDDDSRKIEELWIYPFFSALDEKPSVICNCLKNGWYQITLNGWNTISVSNIPSPEEKYLYNQLVDSAMTEFGDRDGISDAIFEVVAEENNISIEKLKKIYESVKLWMLAQ